MLIVADDLGWTDAGSFGSKYYRTPNMDRLSRQGMKFTNAYACGPNCAPTRACLMSGQYTPRHGVYTVGSDARGKERFRKLVPVKNKTTLDPSYVTLAESLKKAGYVTAHFGKWHLGSPGHAGPEEQGFDYNFGGNHTGAPSGGYFSPYENPQLTNGPKGEHLTDRLSRDAARFIADHKGKPFFVYLSFYAVHSPWMGKENLIEQYKKRPSHGGHSNPTYAAMIETMDDGVGRVLNALDELKLTERTLVIFYSDNGGVGGYHDAGINGKVEVTSQAPLRGGKGMLYEGGVRVPMIVRWPGVTNSGSRCDTPVITVDFYPTLAKIAGVQIPDPHDGIDIQPLLKEKHIADRDLFWHFPGYLEAKRNGSSWRTTPAGVIRSGDWKLLQFFESDRLELYNLKNDIGEKHNLALDNPTKRDELYRKLTVWQKSVHAPIPQPLQKERLKLSVD